MEKTYNFSEICQNWKKLPETLKVKWELLKRNTDFENNTTKVTKTLEKICILEQVRRKAREWHFHLFSVNSERNRKRKELNKWLNYWDCLASFYKDVHSRNLERKLEIFNQFV